MCRHRRIGAGPDWHQPFLAALAGEHDKAAPRPHCVARQRHQFGGTQPRSIQKLDQRRQPQHARIARVSHLLLGQRCKQPVDVARIERFGQRSCRHGLRQITSRIVRFQAFAGKKTEELAYRG